MFDAGGNLELFDHELYGNVVVRDATAPALAEKIDEVLTTGHITTVKLSDPVTGGEQKWLDFHSDFTNNKEQIIKVRVSPKQKHLHSQQS